MGPVHATRSVLANLTDFSGRASRSECWWWFAIAFVGLCVATMLVSVLTLSVIGVTEPGVLGIALTSLWVAAFLLGLAVSVRRLHDTGRSGWWWLIAFVPLGNLILLILWALDSESSENEWGPPPVGSSYYAAK